MRARHPAHRPEAVQKGNPHKLVINQHILPAESIRRFCNADGRLMVARLDTGKVLKSVRPTDSCFTVRRVWDQRTETGSAANVERQFQFLMNRVVQRDMRWWDYESDCVPAFYALWHARALGAKYPTPNITLSALAPERGLGTDALEQLEANSVIGLSDEGTVSGRFFTGFRVQKLMHELTWKVRDVGWQSVHIEPGAGELVVPDYPFALYIPISPTCVLVDRHGPKKIDRHVLREMNSLTVAMSTRQVFARDFAACPMSPVGPACLQAFLGASVDCLAHAGLHVGPLGH